MSQIDRVERGATNHFKKEQRIRNSGLNNILSNGYIFEFPKTRQFKPAISKSRSVIQQTAWREEIWRVLNTKLFPFLSSGLHDRTFRTSIGLAENRFAPSVVYQRSSIESYNHAGFFSCELYCGPKLLEPDKVCCHTDVSRSINNFYSLVIFKNSIFGRPRFPTNHLKFLFGHSHNVCIDQCGGQIWLLYATWNCCKVYVALSRSELHFFFLHFRRHWKSTTIISYRFKSYDINICCVHKFKILKFMNKTEYVLYLLKR